MKKELKTELLTSLGWALIMLSTALAARWAHAHNYIDGDTQLRVVALNGLWLAYYGNRLPKSFVPSACARQAKRFAGWAMVLSGLVYAGYWALAPIAQAIVFGTGAVAVGGALTLGYCVWLSTQRRAA